MGHGLFVVGAIGGKFLPMGKQRLTDACHVAMSEDGPNTCEDRRLLAFDHDHLPGHEFDQSLCRREAKCFCH